MLYNLTDKPDERNNKPIYINDETFFSPDIHTNSKLEKDNINAYVSLNLNASVILEFLHFIIHTFGEANEKNEFDYESAVNIVLREAEVYDEVWKTRDNETNRKHSRKGLNLFQKIIDKLDEIPDGCAESFPYDLIDHLKAEIEETEK